MEHLESRFGVKRASPTFGGGKFCYANALENFGYRSNQIFNTRRNTDMDANFDAIVTNAKPAGPMDRLAGFTWRYDLTGELSSFFVDKQTCEVVNSASEFNDFRGRNLADNLI